MALNALASASLVPLPRNRVRVAPVLSRTICFNSSGFLGWLAFIVSCCSLAHCLSWASSSSLGFVVMCSCNAAMSGLLVALASMYSFILVMMARNSPIRPTGPEGSAVTTSAPTAAGAAMISAHSSTENELRSNMVVSLPGL